MRSMSGRVYLETSIVSYLTARPSRDILAVAHQQISTEWWERRRGDFDLVISVLVLSEARRGDPDAAQRRLDLLKGIPRVEVTEAAKEIATKIVQEGLLSQTAYPDALHIATATVHEVDYLSRGTAAISRTRRSCPRWLRSANAQASPCPTSAHRKSC